MRALPSAAPALLFGLRLWAAVCLSLYIAFWLELDNAFWAGTSAAIVCTPKLGASLRKGWYRMVGTIVGAVAIVALTACFPQNRAAFLLSLALWGAACAFMATVLRNFASYSAALAGITAAIITSDQLGAVGGLNGEAFRLAVARASEICIGIVCAGVVLAATDFGGAARRLSAQLAAIAAETMGRFTSTLLLAGSELPDTRAVRRGLIGRVAALDPVIDEALGESAQFRYHSPVFQMTVDGLFAALAGWRTVATRLERLPRDQARAEAGAVLQLFPQALRSAPLLGEPTRWVEHPASLRVACDEAVRTLSALPTDAPSLRLLADQAADILSAASQALLTLGLLVDDPAGPNPPRGSVRLRVPDWLPALVNAARAFVTIGLVALFWIVTGWPNGALAIAFASIVVILLAPRADQSYAAAVGFLTGIGLTAILAAIVEFAVLPSLAGFAAFSAALGLVLVPAGALMTQPWQTATFTAMAFFFIPLLAPANHMNYDPQQFYNTASAIVVGVATAALAFRLLPPLSPALRTRRLLALTLRELRHLATGPMRGTAHDWQSRIYSRLSVLPEQAELLQRGELLAALCVGVDIIRLRRVAPPFDQPLELDAALKAVACGNSVVAAEHLAQLDRRLAALPGSARPGPQIRLRARASIVALAEALTRHAAYFDTGAAG
ncbi:MAG: FUSC family protein [Rhodopila sp.]